MSQTKSQMSSAPATSSTGKDKRPVSVHSSIRSSHDGLSNVTPDKLRERDLEPETPRKLEEGEIEPHMYELNAPRAQRSYFRRHLFMILLVFVGLAVVGTIIGVLVVKVALRSSVSADPYGWIVITATRSDGEVYTTKVPQAFSSIATEDTRPTSTAA